MNNEERQSAIAVRIRKGRRFRETVLCDWCGERAGDTQHEIFPKHLTSPNTYQRELTESRYVISMLCIKCHLEIQPIAEANRVLLDMNRDFWGFDAVDNHIRLLREAGVRVEFQNRA